MRLVDVIFFLFFYFYLVCVESKYIPPLYM